MAQKDPRKALMKLIEVNFCPLLTNIESKAGSKKYGMHSLFSQADKCQSQIIYNDDTVAIFSDIIPMLRAMYLFYFDMEHSAAKGTQKYSTQDLKRASLTSVLQFVKDFSISPYILHQKVCFFVWHDISETIGKRDSVSSLCKNFDQSMIVQPQHQLGKVFTLSHFIIFIYRICILSYDH